MQMGNLIFSIRYAMECRAKVEGLQISSEQQQLPRRGNEEEWGSEGFASWKISKTVSFRLCGNAPMIKEILSF